VKLAFYRWCKRRVKLAFYRWCKRRLNGRWDRGWLFFVGLVYRELYRRDGLLADNAW
jgi:hypothetical protein